MFLKRYRRENDIDGGRDNVASQKTDRQPRSFIRNASFIKILRPLSMNVICLSLSGLLRDKTIDHKLIYIPDNDKLNYPSVNWIQSLENTGK